MKRVAATAKKLRALARACDREAAICQRAGECPGVEEPALHAKNAGIWRGRARTCWKAVLLLTERG